jgi:hypothetical protein
MAKWATLQVFSIKCGLFKSSYVVIKCGYEQASVVTTLALGLWPRQGLIGVWAKREARESHLMFFTYLMDPFIATLYNTFINNVHGAATSPPLKFPFVFLALPNGPCKPFTSRFFLRFVGSMVTFWWVVKSQILCRHNYLNYIQKHETIQTMLRYNWV